MILINPIIHTLSILYITLVNFLIYSVGKRQTMGIKSWKYWFIFFQTRFIFGTTQEIAQHYVYILSILPIQHYLMFQSLCQLHMWSVSLARKIRRNRYTYQDLTLLRDISLYKCSAGIILCMRPANERRRYIVTSSPIGCAHAQKDPWFRARLYRIPLSTTTRIIKRRRFGRSSRRKIGEDESQGWLL